MFNPQAFLIRNNLITSTTALSVSRLKGGLWNDVLRVKSDNFDWVLKRFHQEEARERLYPVLPESEALALKTLKQTAIAPEFVAYFPASKTERAILIYDFFTGDLATNAFTDIADLMKRYHHLAIEKDSFRDLATKPEELLLQADNLLNDCEQDLWLTKLKALRPKPRAVSDLVRRSLVHTDAWIGNFIENDTSLALIDWQCPGMGDPAEDIWTFLYSGFEQLLDQPPFIQAEKQVFLNAYADPQTLERLKQLEPFFALRAAAHCLMRVQDLAESNPKISAVYLRILEQLMGRLSHVN